MVNFPEDSGKFASIAFLCFLNYVLGMSYFFYQGQLIELVVNKETGMLWRIGFLVICVKFFLLLNDVILQNLKDYFSIDDYHRKLLEYYPSKIYQDIENKSSYIYDTLHASLYPLFQHRVGYLHHLDQPIA